MAGAAETQMAPPMMWQSPAPQQPLPGTPRSSKNQAEDAPRTPLVATRGGLSATSPALHSPWLQGLRTPSPDHCRYNMASFKASQQQEQQQQQQLQQQQQQQQACA